MALILQKGSLINKLFKISYSSIPVRTNIGKTIFSRDLKTNTCNMKPEDSGPVSLAIEEKLRTGFNPAHLEVINESYQHNAPPGSESHFKVVVVSSQFENTPLIKRHRLVNDVLAEELNTSVHALSIVAKTPSQWESSSKVVEKSPACRGGFGK